MLILTRRVGVFSPGEQIAFQAENGLDERNLTIQWDFGDGTQATGDVVQHSYAQAGQYQISVIGTTAQAEKSQVFYAPIFVNPVSGDDRVDAFIVEPSSLVVAQAGSVVRFEGASNFPVSYFFWEVAGSNVTHRGASFDYQVPQSLDDDYLDIRLFAVNSDGFASVYPDYRPVYVYQTNIPPEGTLISPTLDEEGVYAAELGENFGLRSHWKRPRWHRAFSVFLDGGKTIRNRYGRGQYVPTAGGRTRVLLWLRGCHLT